MTFKELRKLSGMTQKAFSEYFNIPRRTIEDWETEKRKCTPYLLDLMQYKLENEGFLCEKVYVKMPQGFNGDLKKEVDKLLVKAHREASLSVLKSAMKSHEEWKEKHPRPKKNKEDK